MSAHWLVRWETLKRCLSKSGRFEVMLIASGQLLSSGSRPAMESTDFSRERLKLYQDLERIGKIIKDPILLNLDSWAESDWQVSVILRQILESPVLELNAWAEVTHEFAKSDAEKIRINFANELSGPIQLKGRDKAILCGNQLDLGPTIIRHTNVRLADPLVKGARKSSSGEEVLVLAFLAEEDNKSTIEYVDWLQQGDASGLSNPNRPYSVN